MKVRYIFTLLAIVSLGLFPQFAFAESNTSSAVPSQDSADYSAGTASDGDDIFTDQDQATAPDEDGESFDGDDAAGNTPGEASETTSDKTPGATTGEDDSTSEDTGTPKTPDSSDLPSTPEAPNTPESLGAPQASNTPEAAGVALASSPDTATKDAQSAAQTKQDTAKQPSDESKATGKQQDQQTTNKKEDSPKTPATVSTKAKTTTNAKAEPKPNTGKGDLAPGSYYIVSALRASQVLDVENSSKNNGANVSLFHVHGGKNEQWAIEVGKDGLAIIKSLLSGKVLDVANSSKSNGANILQWQATGNNNQKWIIKKHENYYLIYSALGSNYVLEVYNSSTKNGTNIELWKAHKGKNQLFDFISTKPKGTTAGKQEIEDGLYQLRPEVSTGRPIDIENASTKDKANASTFKAHGGPNQAFYFKYDGKGFYTVTNVKSGKQLAPEVACSVAGINVSQQSLGNKDLAKWKLVKKGNNYQLINKVTGTALNIEGGKDANGTNVETWKASSATSEKFNLKKQSLMPTGPAIIELIASGLVLDVYEGKTNAGAKISTFTNGRTTNQKFLIKEYENGYTIRPFNSRLYLTASSGGLIQDKAQKKMANQIWNAVEAGGAIMLVNASTGLAINVNGTLSKPSTNITTEKPSKKAPQRFFFHEVPVVESGVYYIASSSSPNLVLDVANGRRTNNGNIQLWKKGSSNNQKFYVSELGSGLYSVTNVASGRAIEIRGSSKSNGANVQTFSNNGTNNQKWKIELDDNFTLRFTNAATGTCLNINKGELKSGSNVNASSVDNSKAQQFWLQDAQRGLEVVSIGVPCYMQNPELPTGCESVALTNAIKYWGYNIGKTTIANSWMPYGGDGVYNFIGSPYDSSGWIICAPGIANTGNNYLRSQGSSVVARNITGTNLEGLRAYLDKGCPVVVWTSIGMGEPGGATYRHGYPLRNNNHAVVLTGYNPYNGQYQVADSLAGTVWRDGGRFRYLYNLMGKQAVVLED